MTHIQIPLKGKSLTRIANSMIPTAQISIFGLASVSSPDTTSGGMYDSVPALDFSPLPNLLMIPAIPKSIIYTSQQSFTLP
jgi:hypothetical protein